MQPIVDGLEQKLGTKIHIIRLNIQEPAGRELAPVYDFQYTPTFIFFDAQGHELWRQVGELDTTRVIQSVEAP